MKGKSRSLHRRNLFRRKALALAIGAVTFSLANTGWSQATSGTIYGTVPAAAGETIQITGGAGFNRTVEVDANGKYSVTLPVGTYTVTLLRDGKVVDSRKDVSPVAAGAVAVDFAARGAASSAETLNEIKVTGQAATIDVSTTNQVTTITAKQLQQLPIARTAEDIALLAPGVNMGSPELMNGPLGTPVLVFGGASSVVLGCLILKSTFVPRILGPLMMLDGLGYLTFSLAAFLFPSLAAHIFPTIPFVTAAIGEGALFLWLIVKGVNAERWREQAATMDQWALEEARFEVHSP